MGKISNLTSIFQMGWNHQLEYFYPIKKRGKGLWSKAVACDWTMIQVRGEMDGHFGPTQTGLGLGGGKKKSHQTKDIEKCKFFPNNSQVIFLEEE